MKEIINKLLKPFSVEMHGKGYMQRLVKSSNSINAFDVQKKLLPNAKIIFDVGANRGDVTNSYLNLFPKAVIHAFEPTTEFFETFQNRFVGNSMVKSNLLALSDRSGTADFYINNSGDTNSLLPSLTIGANSDRSCKNKEIIKVPVVKLDDYCLTTNVSSIDILKMDTQGSELAILRGAERLLSENNIKLIYTEAYCKPQYVNQPLLYDIAKYLMQFGYCLEGIYDTYYNEKFMLWCDAIFVNGKV